jgi:hypothetical protein
MKIFLSLKADSKILNFKYGRLKIFIYIIGYCYHGIFIDHRDTLLGQIVYTRELYNFEEHLFLTGYNCIFL